MLLPGTLAYEDLRFHILFNIVKETTRVNLANAYVQYLWVLVKLSLVV
jgi:hypothetical protein